MADKNIYFQFVPIFNQSRQIWTEFVHIECVTDEEMLDYYTDKEGKKRIMHNYAFKWRASKYSFAFAAYHDEQMIGFVDGYLESRNEMWLDSLYVLPKYQKMGIGTNLLKMAERTSSIVANRINLIPLSESKNFYIQKNGYGYRGYMGKDLSDFATGVVPVFQWIKRNFNFAMNVKVDGYMLRKNEHQPTFVYLNERGQVDGVALRTKDGGSVIWTKDNQDKCYDALFQVLNKTR